jgi:hypothetical protein
MLVKCGKCGRETPVNPATEKCYYCDAVIEKSEKEELFEIQYIPGLINVKISPNEGIAQLDGKNGLRIVWNGPRSVMVEAKGNDGHWYEVPYVKSIRFTVSARDSLPTVEIEQYILPYT